MIFQLLFFFMYIGSFVRTQSIIDGIALDNVNQKTTLKCHKFLHKHDVTQLDKNGKACWDTLSVMACWGRCDSKEMADYRFPYKKSFHPVCVHYGRRKVFVILRNCQEGALPSAARYEYYEAADCKCQQCTSLDTSCEGLRYRAHRSGFGGFRRLVRGGEEFF
ncbi:hypothetical protein ABEB36_009108 [Hypothenemus hampei]|uniref:Glycoprotein hormone subunit beta domain-containing protein n=1 Tax=Hypothenemus hampei TaxID=57062 RepID=A0ABD1EP54_HYPHA